MYLYIYIHLDRLGEVGGVLCSEWVSFLVQVTGYQKLRANVHRLVSRINGTFGTLDYVRDTNRTWDGNRNYARHARLCQGRK